VSEDLIDEMITFVRLQLDEDEQKALAIDAKEWAEDSSWFKDMLDPLPSQRRERPGWLPMITVEDVRHIARHDPARVLREVQAKRKVIELYEYAVAAWLLDRDKPNPPTVHLGEKAMAEAVLQALALPYSGRPGYREEWRTQ
jgi:hypothetical protein